MGERVRGQGWESGRGGDNGESVLGGTLVRWGAGLAKDKGGSVFSIESKG